MQSVSLEPPNRCRELSGKQWTTVEGMLLAGEFVLNSLDSASLEALSLCQLRCDEGVNLGVLRI